MSVRIRLQRHGRKQTPIYHIVIADARSPRDGSFIERIGMYNPMTKPATIEIDRMKAYEWLKNGAQPTDTVHAILRFKGVMFYKHLQRGVSKGAMTADDAEIKFRAWVDEKEARIEERVKATAAERKERAAQVSGAKKGPKKKETVKDDELLNVDLAEAAAAETADDQTVETSSENVAENSTENSSETTAENTPDATEANTEEASEDVSSETPAEETPEAEG
ncbi:MAG TPA: 30S ribosomal protein S16 [Saprospiraceae bacterium]|nr:30S ribosomal protein S16 [Saprospiraceae bacterium]